MANTLKIKRGTAATIPQGQLAEPLFTTDTYDLYIGKGSGGNQKFQQAITLTTTGSSGASTFVSNVLNVPTYTISGLGGEPAIMPGTTAQYWRGDKSWQTLDTSVVPENGPIYFTEPRVRSTVLTGLNLSGGGTISATDSVLTAFGKVQNQISALVGGATYQGTWNASTNTPSLASGVGTKGYYYVVSVAGSTNLDGITDWKIGDWAIFNGTTWDKVDNTDAVSSVNGFTGAVNLALDNISDVSAASPTNAQLLRFNGTSSLWENWTPTFEPALTKGNLTEATSSVLTITGGTGAVIGSGTTIAVASAGAAQNGVVTTGAQTFAGVKTFSSTPVVPALHLADMTAGTGALYYNTGAKRLTLANYNADGILVFEVNGGAFAMQLNADLTARLNGYTTNGFVKFSSSNGTLTVDTNNYLTTSSAASTYVPYTGATTNVNIGTNSMTAFNFYASSTFYVDSNNYFMKSILELRDNATSTKRIYITADTSESLISTVNTVPLKLRATSGVTEQLVLNTNGTISFTGAATFSSSVSTGNLSLSGGTIQCSGDYYIGTNNANFIQFYTSNQNRMIITSGGNVGIGTTSPDTYSYGGTRSFLTFRANGTNQEPFLQLIADGTGNSLIDFGNATIRRATIIGFDGSHLAFFTNGSNSGTTTNERMRITSGGNVGIGTSSPVSFGSTNTVLSVNNVNGGGGGGVFVCMSDGNQGLRMAVDSSSSALWEPRNVYMRFATNDTERMRITSGGNVLIGTTDNTAAYRLNVAVNGGSAYMGVTNQAGGSGDRYLRIGFGSGATVASIQGTRVNVADDVNIALNPDGGSVFIGTSSISSQGERFFVTATNLGAMFRTTGGSTNNWAANFWNNATSGNNLFVEFGTETAYTGRGSIDYNRGAGQTRYNTTSDVNLKNVIGLSDRKISIDILSSTKIREYSWKEDSTENIQIGVIAQELYQTFKGAVSKGSEQELFGTKDYKNWGVDKTAFTFHLIAGWQEHERIIKEQQSQIEELKSKLN